jgi:hypothetical protein
VKIKPNLGNQYLSFLSNGDITPLSPTSISIYPGFWHCINIVWRYSNEIDSTDGFIMDIYWDNVLTQSQHYDSYLDLDLMGPNAVWGVSAGMGYFGGISDYQHYRAEQKIQFMEMKNEDNINFDKFLQKQINN